MVTMRLGRVKERVDSERNQGRAPDMGWLDHDRLGFNYRLTDIACAIGLVQLERLDGMLADRARVAALVPRGAGAGCERARAAVRGRRRRPRGWFVYVVQLPHRRRPRRARSSQLRELGVAVQAVPARDPPDVVLPRALRPPRGRVPGLRGRRRALDRAAVLPAR